MVPTIYRDAHDGRLSQCVKPSNVVRSLTPILESKCIDQSGQRRGLLAAARIVKKEAQKRRAPVLQRADQRSAHSVFRDPGKRPVEAPLGSPSRVHQEQ